uniref:Uncharacterized protein n=1 Tax=Panstrongylus lignarius TaxID=156445 RepID=A0A224XZ53_9HEMI
MPVGALAVVVGADLALVGVRGFGGDLVAADTVEVLLVGVPGFAEGGLLVGAVLLTGVEGLLEAVDGLAVLAGLAPFVEAPTVVDGFLGAVVRALGLAGDLAVTEEDFTVGVFEVSNFLTIGAPLGFFCTAAIFSSTFGDSVTEIATAAAPAPATATPAAAIAAAISSCSLPCCVTPGAGVVGGVG